MLPAVLSNLLSFPGLGIGEFNLNPVAFEIPLPWSNEKHPIMWYGIIVAFAMIVGFAVALRKARQTGIKTDYIYDLAIFLIIFSMIGSRLYYVIMSPDEFDSFADIISIWNGGLAIYGGVIAGAITIFIFSKVNKIKTAKLLDIAAPGLIIGQAIGRWGNFFNAEAYGSVTDLPWRMCSDKFILELQRKGLVSAAEISGMEKQTLGVHPTFLYECIWNIIGFILINHLYKKKKYDGQVTLFYAVWYGFGRFFIESLRTDSLYLFKSLLGETLRVSQLVAAICVIVGIILMIILGNKARDKRMDEEIYEAIYTDHSEPVTIKEESGITNENKLEHNKESEDKGNGENN